MTPHRFLAFDLGAESGRAMLGVVSDDEIALEELHRFPNDPVRLPSGLYWDMLRLFYEMRQGLRIAGRERKLRLDGIGIDTWGVDFGILGADGALVDNPRHYRDSRNDGMPEKAFAIVPRERIFAETGLQFMQINSLYQWLAMHQAHSPALTLGKTLLFAPDLLNYWLTGVARAEITIASTSQFYDPSRRRWASEMLREFGLEPALLPPLIQPGELLGPLLGELADASGLSTDTPVYASAGHDTAAAVAAVPAEGNDW